MALSINKQDFDYGVTLDEVIPNSKYFNPSHIVGRASYAQDPTKRKLLHAHKVESIPFSNTHLVSKQLNKGSRLLVYIHVNKNPFSELNYLDYEKAWNCLFSLHDRNSPFFPR